jgi:hypothetical protein
VTRGGRREWAVRRLAALAFLFPLAPCAPPPAGATTPAPGTTPATAGACSGDCDASAAVGAGEEECVEFRLASRGEAVADALGEVRESDESNNTLAFDVAFPSSCDVPPPPCAETPVP